MLCLDYAWVGCKGGCEVSIERAPFVQTTLKTQSGPYSAVCTLCCGVKHLGTTRRTDQGSNKDKGLTVGHRFFKFFTFFVGGSNTLTDPHSGRSFVKKKGLMMKSLWFGNTRFIVETNMVSLRALLWAADSCFLSKLFNVVSFSMVLSSSSPVRCR